MLFGCPNERVRARPAALGDGLGSMFRDARAKWGAQPSIMSCMRRSGRFRRGALCNLAYVLRVKNPDGFRETPVRMTIEAASRRGRLWRLLVLSWVSRE